MEKLYIKAAEEAGYRYENGRLVGMTGEDDGEEALDRNGEVRYSKSSTETDRVSFRKKRATYIPYEKVGMEKVRYIKAELKKIYGNEDGVADGIAIEYGNQVFVVDSGCENGVINIGFRRIEKSENENVRKEQIRRINDDAISKGYISDGLSSRIGSGRGGSSDSIMRQKSGTELQTNSRESGDHVGRTDVKDSDGRGRLTSEGKSGSLDVENGTRFRKTSSGKDVVLDSNQTREYNTQKGVNTYERTDEFVRLQEESRRMSDSELQSYRSGSKVISSEKLKRLSVVFAKEIERANRGGVLKQQSLVNPKTHSEIQFFENIDGRVFHDIFEISRSYLQNSELVDLHDDYSDARCFLSSDGLCGFAIEQDGNLVSVYNLGEKGFLDTIREYVVEKGATHLDGYNSPRQPLQYIYERKLGFKTASIMDYNMEYDHDNIAENHGSPQVAFMVNTDAEVTTKHFSKDQYDEAVAYQKSFIEKGIRFRKTNGEDYTYQNLTSKPDMKVTVIRDGIDYVPSKQTRDNLVDRAMKNAASVGYTNENGNVFVHVNDIETDVMIGKNAIRHGLDRRLNVLGPVVVKSGEILRNSIRINELSPRDANIDHSYVLIGMAKNQTNVPYPVLFVVNGYSNEVVSMEVLYSINAKKESARLDDAGVPAQAVRYLTDSTISISHLLDFVNTYFPDVLPEDVLKHYGVSTRPDGVLGKSVLFRKTNGETTERNEVEIRRVTEEKPGRTLSDYVADKKLEFLSSHVKTQILMTNAQAGIEAMSKDFGGDVQKIKNLTQRARASYQAAVADCIGTLL